MRELREWRFFPLPRTGAGGGSPSPKSSPSSEFPSSAQGEIQTPLKWFEKSVSLLLVILRVVQELDTMILVGPFQPCDYPGGVIIQRKQELVTAWMVRGGPGNKRSNAKGCKFSPVIPELALPLSVPWPGKIPISVPGRCQGEQHLRVKPTNWQGLGNYRCA